MDWRRGTTESNKEEDRRGMAEERTRVADGEEVKKLI